MSLNSISLSGNSKNLTRFDDAGSEESSSVVAEDDSGTAEEEEGVGSRWGAFRFLDVRLLDVGIGVAVGEASESMAGVGLVMEISASVRGLDVNASESG